MPFTPKTLEEKPYNMCIDCLYIGKHCDGPNFLAMEMPRLSEWCRLRKEYLHAQDPKWTNSYIAKQADVSKVSVDRFLSGNFEDIKMSTVARILRVLVNGTWGQYPCAMAGLSGSAEGDNSALSTECKRLQAELDSVKSDDRTKIDFLKEQIAFRDKELLTKDKLLDERADYLRRKDKYIRALAVALGFAIAIICAALILDRLNSDVGFFWLESMLNHRSASPSGLINNLLGWRM